MTTIPAAEQEILDLWSQYEYRAAQAKKDLKQARWDLEAQYEISIEEFDADTAAACETALMAARKAYTEAHRDELKAHKVLRTF